MAANGEELPSARLLSTQFAQEADIPYENYTLLVMQWGQFLDHDLTHTPISRGKFWQDAISTQKTAVSLSSVRALSDD